MFLSNKTKEKYKACLRVSHLSPKKHPESGCLHKKLLFHIHQSDKTCRFNLSATVNGPRQSQDMHPKETLQNSFSFHVKCINPFRGNHDTCPGKRQ